MGPLGSIALIAVAACVALLVNLAASLTTAGGRPDERPAAQSQRAGPSRPHLGTDGSGVFGKGTAEKDAAPWLGETLLAVASTGVLPVIPVEGVVAEVSKLAPDDDIMAVWRGGDAGQGSSSSPPPATGDDAVRPGAPASDGSGAPTSPSSPKPSGPGPSEPDPSDPPPSDPEPTDPAPSDPEPEPTDPAPSEPEPEPEPTDPAPSDPEPEPTDPAPSEPPPSEPADTPSDPAESPSEPTP